MRIIQRDNIFWLQSENSSLPLPPNYPVREEADFVIRLRSTRRGNAAWWTAGESARAALNDSYYEPMMRAVVTDFSWSPPARHRYPALAHPAEVIQRGSEVLNFYCRVKQPLADRVREWLRKLDVEPSELSEPQRQGRLTVTCLEYSEPPVEPDLDLIRALRYPAMYNHIVCAPSIRTVGPRVINGFAKMVVIASEDVYVLSRDHPQEPILLSGCVAGTAWLLSHPLPEGPAD